MFEVFLFVKNFRCVSKKVQFFHNSTSICSFRLYACPNHYLSWLILLDSITSFQTTTVYSFGKTGKYNVDYRILKT